MTVAVIRGDTRALPLPDASADLVVTSPPYWQARAYGGDGGHYPGELGAEDTPAAYIAALTAATAEWVRVLKPSGSLFVVLGDRYATGNSGETRLAEWSAQHARGGGHAHTRARQRTGRAPGFAYKSLMMLPARYAIACTDQLGLILRAEIVWSKPNGLPESVTDRVRRSHEAVFHFTRRRRYYAAPGKRPGSVWPVPSQRLTAPAGLGGHPAAFPAALIRPVVTGWSPAAVCASCNRPRAPGWCTCPPSAPARPAVVLDPCGGTGTVAMVADVLGRTGITVDRSAGYCRLAAWRTADPQQRADAAGLPPPPPVADGQAALFDVA